MTVISIITTDVTLAKVIDSELTGVEHELIIAPWDQGFSQANGKFVCFLEDEADFRGGLFVRGLLDILIKPGYSKLAMISPAIEELAADRTVFGWDMLESGQIVERLEPKSLAPYHARVGYVPGAIIRTTALEEYKSVLHKYLSVLQLSIDFSMLLWNSGKQVHVDPKMVYQIDNIDRNRRKGAPIKPNTNTLQIWKRESV